MADAARQAAESYIGRPLSDTEYDYLVRATNAEADPGNPTEAAMVAASILNRSVQTGLPVWSGTDNNNSVLMAPYQFESVTGTNGKRYTPSSTFDQGPSPSTRAFIENSFTGILPNVSHKQTDFTAAQPAAYAGPGHDLAYFHQAQANYNQVGGSLFNTPPPNGSAPPPQTAQVTPPTPRLRPDGTPSLNAGSGMNGAGGFGPPVQTASFQPQSAPAPQSSGAPTSTASSWLPSSLQPGGAGFVDDLGGGSSPLHRYNVYEPADVSPGPYGADALVKAAISGDTAAFNKALGDLTGAATHDVLPKVLGGTGLGMDGVQAKLQGYFDQLQQTAPGAIRAMQTAYNSNPDLQKAIPPQLMPAVQGAFNALPPQSTGTVAMPNLRPSTIPQTPQQPAAPSGPTMVSYPSLPPKPGANPGSITFSNYGADVPGGPNFGSLPPLPQTDPWSSQTVPGLDQQTMQASFNRSPAPSPGSIAFSNYGADVSGGPNFGNPPPLPTADPWSQQPIPGLDQNAMQAAFGRSQAPPSGSISFSSYGADVPGGPNFGGGASNGFGLSPPSDWSSGQPLPLDAGDAGSNPNVYIPQYDPQHLSPSQWDAMDAGGGSTTTYPPSYNIPPVSSLNPSQQRAMGDYSNYVPPLPTTPGSIAFSNYGADVPGGPNFGLTLGAVAPSIWQPQIDSWLSSGPMPVDDNGKPLRPTMPMQAPMPTQRPPMPYNGPLGYGVMPRVAGAINNAGKAITGWFGTPTGNYAAQPSSPPPNAMSSFMAAAGPAPQNVNWAATLAPDAYAQPGTDNTYVLNDLGYGGGDMGGPGFNAFVYG